MLQTKFVKHIGVLRLYVFYVPMCLIKNKPHRHICDNAM